MWVFCACPAWCCWIRHPHRSFRPRRMTKTYYGWTTLDPRFVSKYQTFACFLQWDAGANGQTFAHCDISAEYTRGLSTSTRPETVLTDGRTDVKKKCVCFLSPFGLDRSKLDGYFCTLDAFFRTFGRRPDAPQQKRYVWRKKCLCMFALYRQIFQGKIVALKSYVLDYIINIIHYMNYIN